MSLFRSRFTRQLGDAVFALGCGRMFEGTERETVIQLADELGLYILGVEPQNLDPARQ